MLYYAYGSNLCMEQMLKRCPKAEPIKRLKIEDFKLVFRGVADIEQCPGSTLDGALWEITKECEHELDIYEGVDFYLYSKEYFDYHGEEVLTYTMNEKGILPPNDYYFHVIKQGFKDFGIPFDTLDAAIQESWQYKQPTHYLRKRRYNDQKMGRKRYRGLLGEPVLEKKVANSK